MIPSGSRKRNLVLIIVALLLTNIGMLLYFTVGKQKPPQKKLSRADRQAEFMKKEVGFDTIQVTQYRKLNELRDSALVAPNEALRQSKLAMMDLLKQPAISDSDVQRVVDSIGEKQQAVEIVNFRHFQRVRELCNAQQKMKYDTMLYNMVQRMAGGNNNQKKK